MPFRPLWDTYPVNKKERRLVVWKGKSDASGVATPVNQQVAGDWSPTVVYCTWQYSSLNKKGLAKIKKLVYNLDNINQLGNNYRRKVEHFGCAPLLSQDDVLLI